MTAEAERLDVVAVAPHPDDLEILCGGTLAKLVRQGYRVGMFDLTTGEPTPRGSEEIRAREAEEARQVLGVPLRINLKLPNRELMDCPANRYVLATAFRRYRPGVVIGVLGRTPAASPDHHQGSLRVVNRGHGTGRETGAHVHEVAAGNDYQTVRHEPGPTHAVQLRRCCRGVLEMVVVEDSFDCRNISGRRSRSGE